MSLTVQQTVNEFEFLPLNESEQGYHIRILTILPGHSDITCHLSHEPISTKDKYEALSYCWGTDHKDQKILLANSGSDQTPSCVNVTSNLLLALERLRLPDEPRRVWVDALCINQADSADKTCQIKLMHNIYRNASRVLVWLGPEADGSHGAMNFIPTIVAVAERDRAAGIQRDMSIPSQCPEEFPQTIDLLWENLYRLLDRDWFKRAWIIQEIAASVDALILCGPDEVSWDHFCDAFIFISSCAQFVLDHGMIQYKHLLRLASLRLLESGERSILLMHVLPTYRKQLKTDPRDAIFAFHGLFEVGSSGWLSTLPDYDIGVQELYIRVAHAILLEDQSLDMLSLYRDNTSASIAGLPSWVPDWNVSLYKDCMSSPTYASARFNAASDSTHTVTLSADGTRLHLKGFNIARIEAVSRLWTTNHIVNPSLEQIRDIFDIIDNFKQVAVDENHTGVSEQAIYKRTGEEMCDAYLKTLLRSCYSQCNFTYDEMFESYMAWQSYDLIQRISLAQSIIEGVDQTSDACVYMAGTALFGVWVTAQSRQFGVDTFMELMKFSQLAKVNVTSSCQLQKMMRSEDGLIGIAPKLTEVGDVVVLAEGSHIPFVLRPKSGCKLPDQRGMEYEFIGEAYVHGVMDGSEWIMRKQRGEDMEEFILV